MKKLIALALCLMMVLVVLTACGGKTESKVESKAESKTESKTESTAEPAEITEITIVKYGNKTNNIDVTSVDAAIN